MTVRIRMKPMGRKHRPFYRICVMDSRKANDSKAIEELGTYDPMVPVKANRVKLDLERVDYWVSVGAQPSEKVNALIRKVRSNKFGTAKAAPEMKEAKPLPTPAAEAAPTEGAEAEAESTEAEAPAEGSEG